MIVVPIRYRTYHIIAIVRPSRLDNLRKSDTAVTTNVLFGEGSRMAANFSRFGDTSG